MPLEALHAACDRVQDLVNGVVENPYIGSNFQRFALLSGVVRYGRQPIHYHRQLLYLLNVFSHREASDPRDKVYGLLGLSEEAASSPGSFPVDYGKDVLEVYKDTARYLIETADTLDVLRAQLGAGKVDGLPSWVPDWTTTQGRSAHGLSHFREPMTIDTPEGNTKAVAVFCSNNAVLKARGFIIGTLAEEFDFEPNSVSMRNGPTNSPLISIASTLWLLSHMFLRFVGRVHTVLKLLQRLPGLSYIYNGILRFGVRETRFAKEPLVNQHLDDSRYMNPVPQSMQGFATFLFLGGDTHSFPPTVKTFTVYEASGHRGGLVNTVRICSTLARDARPGDLLCFFIGAKSASVVRSIDDHYIYVGPASAGGSYADGLMCDAVKKAYEAGVVVPEVFALH